MVDAVAPTPMDIAGAAVPVPPADLSAGYHKVIAPMVGTFYAAPSPGSPAFVAVGQKVERGDVLGILEAMKLMNEVSSEVSGTVRGVLVVDGAAVEYGQTLFSIELDEAV